MPADAARACLEHSAPRVPNMLFADHHLASLSDAELEQKWVSVQLNRRLLGQIACIHDLSSHSTNTGDTTADFQREIVHLHNQLQPLFNC